MSARFRENQYSISFWRLLTKELEDKGETASSISRKLEKSHGWYGVHLHYKKPFNPQAINELCRHLGVLDKIREDLHWLAARSFGYEVTRGVPKCP